MHSNQRKISSKNFNSSKNGNDIYHAINTGNKKQVKSALKLSLSQNKPVKTYRYCADNGLVFFCTPLAYAITCNDKEMVEFILDQGVSIQEGIKYYWIDKVKAQIYWSPIHPAEQPGSIWIILTNTGWLLKNHNG